MVDEISAWKRANAEDKNTKDLLLFDVNSRAQIITRVDVDIFRCFHKI